MQDNALVQDELTTLKARADQMGLSYHPSIGLEKLRAKVAAALADEPESEGEGDDTADTPAPVPEPVKETEGQRLRRLKQEAMELVRIRLTCMNPAKKDWDGEIICAGNSLVGSVKKYIPFTADDGWHVPRIMLEVLQDRKCQVFVSGKSRAGVTTRQSKIIKEFAIEVLPPLTAMELKDLAQRQAMARGGSD